MFEETTVSQRVFVCMMNKRLPINLADLLEAETVDNIFASDRWQAVPLIA